MSAPTLKRRVSQISIGAFLTAFTVMLASFSFYSVAQKTFAQKEVERDLKRAAPSQIEQLIPSFLLSEQSAGVHLLLERFQKTEDLSHALIVSNQSEIPAEFSSCKLDASNETSCLSSDSRETAVLLPISESGKNFGHLLKAKINISSWAAHDLLQIIGVFAIVLGTSFAAIYIFIARHMSKTIPRSLDRLVQWIESDLSGKKTDLRDLPFAELESLREKISEVMKRHNSDRDQAVIGH